MSSWGLKDNVTLTGNVTTSNTSPNVQGFGGTIFAVEVEDGDYISIAGHKYQAANVVSNALIILNANAATISANVKAYVQQGPKYISNINTLSNTYTIQNIVGIDSNEARVPSNRAKNFKVPGWYDTKTWTGGHGQTRIKNEVLVALSKNFLASSAGDADDDTNALDYLLYFTTQPSNQANVAANSNVTLQVAALSDPTGATITYQWYESPNNIVYAALSNTGVYSGATTNTLAISNVANLNGKYYKVTIANTSADTNTSNIVTITTV